ncbi:hypothetical protein Tco_0401298 [Tanacetum coccineum]
MSNSNTNLQTQSSNALHNAIMEAGSKDRPPMLAPGNYVQWKSRIKRYIDTKPNSELIHYCLQNPPYTYQWTEKTVPVTEGSSETTTKRYMENYKNVSQDIRDQLNAEAEAVQIILIGIDNDIYSTVDACPNACEMWKAIERLKQDGESLESYYSQFYKMMNELVKCHVTNHQVNVQFLLQLQPEWQRFVTLVKQSQELKTVSYHKLYDILKQHQNEVNEIRAERLARTANPLALVAQQQPVYHPQNHPTQNTQYSSTRSQQSTRNRGKAIVTSSAPTYDPEPATVTEDDEMSKEKEIDKLMALISLSFKKIYKPTNNNLRTSSNTSRANQDNSPRINRGTGYDNQRAVNVVGARENVAYHKENMLLCKQEEAGVQLNAEQADWKDDTDDEFEDRELEAHYMYMAQIQEVTPDPVDNSGPIFDDEPNAIIQDNQDDTDDLDQERNLLASLIQKLKCEIDDSKNRNKFLESSNKALVDKLKGEIEDFKTKNKSLESSNNHFKEANNELSKTNQLMFKDLKKFQAELDKYNDVNYVSKFLNEIDRLSREYYDVDHMNAILGVYTDLDEVTNLQCDYLEAVEKCEHLEKELSKSRTMSKSFEALQKHAINLELDLQQCKEKIKNDKSFKENQSNVFLKEREQYFEIQDLKAQLQDKGIAISELKKLIEKMKGKSVETKFEKSSVIRQPNAFKSQRQSILGVIPSTRVSRLQLKGNQLEDRVMPNNSQGKKQNVEDHRSRGTDLYSITLQDSTTPNPICLIAKATSSQAWLWHHRGTSCSSYKVRTGQGTKFLINLLQNTLQKKLSAAKVPFVLWAEANCNCMYVLKTSLVMPRHWRKPPYHIYQCSETVSLSSFLIFGSLAISSDDGENLDKMKEKGDAVFLFDHVSSDPGLQCSTMILEQDNLRPGPQSQDNVPQVVIDSRKSKSGGIQILGGDKVMSAGHQKQGCTSRSLAEREFDSTGLPAYSRKRILKPPSSYHAFKVNRSTSRSLILNFPTIKEP